MLKIFEVIFPRFLAGYAFPRNFKDHRDGERRDAVKPLHAYFALHIQQHVAKPRCIDKPAHRILSRGTEQNMIALVFIQDIVDQVGTERHLPAVLLLAGVAAFHNSCHHGGLAESAFQQRRIFQPFVQLLPHQVDGKQRFEIIRRTQRPDGEGVIRRDEAEGLVAPPRHAAHEQEAAIDRAIWHAVKRGGQTQTDEEILKSLIERHFKYTGSTRARNLLDAWSTSREKFVKVFPNEYKRALRELFAEAQAKEKIAA